LWSATASSNSPAKPSALPRLVCARGFGLYRMASLYAVDGRGPVVSERADADQVVVPLGTRHPGESLPDRRATAAETSPGRTGRPRLAFPWQKSVQDEWLSKSSNRLGRLSLSVEGKPRFPCASWYRASTRMAVLQGDKTPRRLALGRRMAAPRFCGPR